MSSGRNLQVPQAEPFILLRATVPAHTNKQVKASAIGDGVAVSTKWKTLIQHARTIRENVLAENLIYVGDKLHKMARLGQLRDQLSPEQSDQQVRDIFDEHRARA